MWVAQLTFSSEKLRRMGTRRKLASLIARQGVPLTMLLSDAKKKKNEHLCKFIKLIRFFFHEIKIPLISNKVTTHYLDEADMGKAFVGVSR